MIGISAEGSEANNGTPLARLPKLCLEPNKPGIGKPRIKRGIDRLARIINHIQRLRINI